MFARTNKIQRNWRTIDKYRRVTKVSWFVLIDNRPTTIGGTIHSLPWVYEGLPEIELSFAF